METVWPKDSAWIKSELPRDIDPQTRIAQYHAGERLREIEAAVFPPDEDE